MNNIANYEPTGGTGMEMTNPTAEQRGLVAVDQSRAMMEVQGQIVMAKKFPRDTIAAYQRVIEACKRPSLANKALYAYTRGKETVTGPSIRLAEELARSFGNIQYGWRILSKNRVDGRSEVEAFAWDLETNTRVPLSFQVRHWRDTKSGGYRIKDERDIYELCANMAARRVRACILKVIPSDVVEDAVTQVAKTLSSSSDVPLIDRARKMVSAFSQLGVTQEMVEGRLGYALSAITPTDIVNLGAIYNTLNQGEKHPSEFFDMPGAADTVGEDATSGLIQAVADAKSAHGAKV